MKQKVNTKQYGEKNILTRELIDGTYLYKAEVSVIEYGCRFRATGIIDSKYNEVYPFDTAKINTRVINKHLLVDKITIGGCYGVSSDTYGTYVYKINGSELELVCVSEVEPLRLEGNHLLGRHGNLEESNDDYIKYGERFIFDLASDKEISNEIVSKEKPKTLVYKKNN